MTQSFNCLILNTSTIISIPIFNEADKVNKMFIMYQGQKLHVSSFSVAILIEYICKKTNINYPDMKLWKINKKKEEIENKNVLTGEDIEKELNGKEMELQKLFKTYFINELNQANSQDDEDDEDDETAENIHIIAISTTDTVAIPESIDDKLEKMSLEFRNGLGDVRTELGDMRTELGDVRTILGNIYELSARSEVSKFLGSHYTSKFEIFDLNGLEKALYDSQVYVSSYRVHKLSDFIYTKNMRDCLNSAIEYIRKLPNDNSNYFKNLQQLADKGKIALKKWESFENNSNNKTSEKKLYLTNTRSLCIMLMTSYVLDVKLAIANEQAPFNTILDIDFRGRTSGSDISDVTIELGEIKLSSGNKAIKKAYRQLLLRLAVLSFVVEAMNKDEKNKDEKNVKVKCRLIGKIFVPKISEISIQPRWADGIKFSSFAEYHVDIIKIGEKH
ncbi:hypothetical protein GLOIN_2v1475278 [Rhizophagus irregularis DAOM 181602=DAOM 197198]|uniref:Uncharacterized protein n=1 Tax=Rhizophagus irregularis (strain DAOM 181602 / DAOM 197198 / MUCL 43194) TaxID=747089 RepID=A0A2P4QD45_RHIID|nr:hypothetical protein GLOIN_2v1475278 [Rhizophagus irregularis DAOM 181602=DAOM 197198]POG75566.1 hypothetical protein GLOIN_2v1475278 [Rhizophagus irregularis DAOM 181602=DAOM 197198]|eukprot:XP_025182432.1 hypothetical protein GLOIN_2v1475278 [Rhizophagus irregularis DAOM 181602=DAOM 197198]